jgi:hypothetical protein
LSLHVSISFSSADSRTESLLVPWRKRPMCLHYSRMASISPSNRVINKCLPRKTFMNKSFNTIIPFSFIFLYLFQHL